MLIRSLNPEPSPSHRSTVAHLTRRPTDRESGLHWRCDRYPATYRVLSIGETTHPSQRHQPWHSDARPSERRQTQAPPAGVRPGTALCSVSLWPLKSGFGSRYVEWAVDARRLWRNHASSPSIPPLIQCVIHEVGMLCRLDSRPFRRIPALPVMFNRIEVDGSRNLLLMIASTPTCVDLHVSTRKRRELNYLPAVRSINS